MSDLTAEAEKSRAAKLALRSRLLTARRLLPAAERRTRALQLQDQTLSFVRREHPSTIAAYAPVGPEPGGPDLPVALLTTGARVLLPVLRSDNDLDWAEFTGDLVPGPRGLSEPIGPRLGVEALATVDLILVPALAVDRSGRRMGRGGGSYDRALTRASAPAVALLHDDELLEIVPAEPHDRPVNGVITARHGFVALPSAGAWSGRNDLR
ncbi:5-formyltetrahydrofolate cyclo-ligase [Actinoplanes sp. NPDC051411]|uniref:5-formyltetrahydrofolate cyclo-ligase n=1 Tax=Actinoplanes sp. NPDC051411 TaxID=3155522 RepID=UPI0034459DFF